MVFPPIWEKKWGEFRDWTSRRHALFTASQSTRRHCYENAWPRRHARFENLFIQALSTLFLWSEQWDRWWPIVLIENSNQIWKSNVAFWWPIVLKAKSKQKLKSNVFIRFSMPFFILLQFLLLFHFIFVFTFWSISHSLYFSYFYFFLFF